MKVRAAENRRNTKRICGNAKEVRRGEKDGNQCTKSRESKGKVVIQGLATLPSSATVRSRALVYTETRSASLFGLGGVHALLDIRRETVERLLNVDVVLR